MAATSVMSAVSRRRRWNTCSVIQCTHKRIYEIGVSRITKSLCLTADTQTGLVLPCSSCHAASFCLLCCSLARYCSYKASVHICIHLARRVLSLHVSFSLCMSMYASLCVWLNLVLFLSVSFYWLTLSLSRYPRGTLAVAMSNVDKFRESASAAPGNVVEAVTRWLRRRMRLQSCSCSPIQRNRDRKEQRER